MKKDHLLIALIILSMCVLSCSTKQKTSDINCPTCLCPLDPQSIDSLNLKSEQRELDAFYSLMAYAVVFKDFQNTVDIDSSRGYNVGSVLVDDNNFITNWARNSVNVTRNESQHGEVRLMQSYLDKNRTFSLKGFTVYTSLEPCAMCSGMMKLTELHRTVYGQTDDPNFGRAIERLQLNSSLCCDNGYSPYARPVISDKSPDPISLQFDSAYANYKKSNPSIVVNFLATPEAEVIFSKASKLFLDYKTAKYIQNQKYIDSAHVFYNSSINPKEIKKTTANTVYKK